MSKAEELVVKKETAESLATRTNSSKEDTSNRSSPKINSMATGSSRANSSLANTSRLVQEDRSTMSGHSKANNRSTAKVIPPISLSTVKAATCALFHHNAGEYDRLIDLQNPNTSQQNQASYPSYQGQQQKPDLASKLFGGLHGAIYGIGSDIAGKLGTSYEPQPYGSYPGQGGYSGQGATKSRFGSFASPKNGNDVKWHVDGCSYMWAVSNALEGARESIWILDCKHPSQIPRDCH